MSWRDCEPTLEEILSDPIVTAVMAADAVDPREVSAMFSAIGRELRSGRTSGVERPVSD